MATKIDDEIMDDARTENKNFVKKNGLNGHSGANTNTSNQNNSSNTSVNQNGDQKDEKKSGDSGKNEGNGSQDQNANNQNTQQNFDFTNQTQQKDEFEEKFNEFFKNNPLIAGNTAVNLVDDLKSNFFMVYAKKQGVEMPKEAFQMDAKTKEFTAFLVDQGLKGKIFEYVKKYPIVAALGVFGLSAGTTFLMIKMLASEKNEKEEMAEKIKALEKKLWEQKKASASDAEIIKETKDEKKDNPDNVKDFIATM